MKNLFAKLKNSKFFVAVCKVGAGQLIAQILSIVSLPILSRIYSETAYGDFALITSTAALLINFAMFGLNSAVMKPQDDEEAKTVLTTAMIINVIICTLFTGVCAALFNVFKLFDVSSHYFIALIMLWLYTVLNNFYSILTTYLNRAKKYNRLFFNPIIGALANFAIAMPLGLLGFGYLGFMFTHIVQYLICCGHMMWKNFPFKIGYKFRDMIKIFKDYKAYVLYQYPSNIIGNFGIEYPTQYLGRTFTTTQLGGYSMCVNVMKYPIRLIAAPISTVYFRTATEYHREGKNLSSFTFKMIFRILLISALPVAAFIFFSEPIFAFVLGEKWRVAGQLAGFLIIQYVLLFCSQTTSYCRVAIGKQKINLAVTIIRLIIAIASCSIGFVLSGNVVGTVFAYSVGQCIYNIFDLAVNFTCMDKKYTWKFLAISLLYVIFMFALVAIKKYVV